MLNLLLESLYWFEWFVITFFVTLNLFYLFLLMVSAGAVRRYNNEYMLSRGTKLLPQFARPFTLLVPAYNEEETIVDSVGSFLSLDYPEYEVVVASDGSTDGTMDKLKETFHLAKVDVARDNRYECAPIRDVYFSETEPRLVIIDKENGGKADAQNAAANLARYPYVCAVDADSLLSPDSMTKIMQRFTAAPETVGVGGIVRLANGCRVEEGNVTEVRMPKKMIEQIQVVEYLRSFLFGRMGWSRMDILMIISGAFGVFRQDVLARLGGWDKNSVGEDLDVVMRLHRKIHEEHLHQRLSFAPDPVCWTQAPDTLAGLAVQRDRWQRGLMQTLFGNLGMFFNPRYKRIGLIGYPYLFIYEMMGAVVEFTGYPVTIICFALGIINKDFFALFLAVAILWGVCISYMSVALEEISYRRYERRSDLWRLFAAGFLENFGYRQLHAFWRMKGTLKYAFGIGGKGWGTIKRTSFGKSSEESS